MDATVPEQVRRRCGSRRRTTARRPSPAARSSTSTATARPRSSTRTSTTSGCTTARRATNLIPSTCNTTGTLWEYPLVADVDNDGQADIVVASNAYGITCPDDGIEAVGHPHLRQRVGQLGAHAPHLERAHVPHHQRRRGRHHPQGRSSRNWTQPGLNDYRQNKQPGDVVRRARRGRDHRARSAAAAPTVSWRRCATSARRRSRRASWSGFYEGTPPSGHEARPRRDHARRSTRPRRENVVLLLAEPAARRSSTVRPPSTPWSTTACRCTPGTSAAPRTTRRRRSPASATARSDGARRGPRARAPPPRDARRRPLRPRDPARQGGRGARRPRGAPAGERAHPRPLRRHRLRQREERLRDHLRADLLEEPLLPAAPGPVERGGSRHRHLRRDGRSASPAGA